MTRLEELGARLDAIIDSLEEEEDPEATTALSCQRDEIREELERLSILHWATRALISLGWDYEEILKEIKSLG